MRGRRLESSLGREAAATKAYGSAQLRSLRAILLALAALTAAGPASAAAAEKVSLKIRSDGQREILAGGVEVRVAAKGKLARKAGKGRRVKVKVKLASSTFDTERAGRLVKPRRVRLSRSGRGTAKLKLTADGRSQIESCEARTLEASARGATAKADLVRDTKPCRPKPIDLSRADECDFIGAQGTSRCMLPFPDDYYTSADPDTATGRRIDFGAEAAPANVGGTHIAPEPYAGNDGFSPGQTAVVRIPGLDNPDALAETNPVSLRRLGKYEKEGAPIVVIDAATGERWPVWAEIDSNAISPADTALLIHPARNYAGGHRYIVAMRKLRDADGDTLAAPEGFRYYRDDLPSDETAIDAQRGRFDRIFKTLRKADIKRRNLYLAWDFTVASNENIAKNILAMRDDAFADLGDADLADGVVEGDAPAFTVTSVENFEPTDGGPLPEDADMARRVQGTFTVPCYMTDPDGGGPGLPCSPGSRLNLDANGVPQQNGTWTANFNCMIPHAALSTPARASIYGHGLLGSAGEGTSSPQKTLGNTHGIMDCATDEIGMSNSDIPNTIGILGNMSDFPELADRLQQGMLNGLFLGRLLVNPQGFISDPAFRVDDTGPVDGSNPPVIDTSNLYYNGNSQGAIFGGALTAVAPDFTRAALGVGGMNYSVLLNRSVDFDTYAAFLDPAYPDELSQQLLLSMVQMLWDRGESNGYANVATDDPLPNTPPHELLMNIGVGDHQVTNYSAETMARTVGAGIHEPIVYDGRWPGVNVGWGLPAMTYPWTDSALVYWDPGPVRDDPGSPDPADVLGTEVPPIENLPNRTGVDPHENPRRTPAEQQMVSDFLRPDAQSHITDTCGGAPCFDYTFGGP
ncbi:MAG: hypothetical protein BroJett022_13370 [Actinomycetes bacterium]|nr:MAG: hypothetical protein BroJett022_13370 [Actinomycetes bacterium]